MNDLKEIKLVITSSGQDVWGDGVAGKIIKFKGSVLTVPRSGGGGGGLRLVFCKVLVMVLNFLQLYLSYPHVTNLFLWDVEF